MARIGNVFAGMCIHLSQRTNKLGNVFRGVCGFALLRRELEGLEGSTNLLHLGVSTGRHNLGRLQCFVLGFGQVCLSHELVSKN